MTSSHKPQYSHVFLFVVCLVFASWVNAGEFDFMKSEAIGELKLGTAKEHVVKIVKVPAKLGKIERWEADAQYHQRMDMDPIGLSIQLVSSTKKSAQQVESITIRAPNTWKTRAGIGIGSSEKDVIKTYHFHYNKEESEAGSVVVVGSLYGGMMFEIEKGKVVQIFLGAMAE